MQHNSFRDIVVDNLEHIIWHYPQYGKMYQSDPKKNITVIPDLYDIPNYKITKPYNLIYQNESLQHGTDIGPDKNEITEIFKKLVSNNPDKTFMIIDTARINQSAFENIKNCQIWYRKYFAGFFGLTHQGSRQDTILTKTRKHWLCSILGRNEYYRSAMFDWFVDNDLHTSNKISYLAYGDGKERNLGDKQKNYTSQTIHSKHRELIPYNNFEKQSPIDNISRMEKAMPIYDCLFNIIVNAFVMRQTAWHDEKSLNAVLYGHIPLILSGPGSMKSLQDMGIIIPDYVQWSIWDDIPVDQLNYSKQSILQRQLLSLFNKHKLEDISADWYPYAIRNFDKVKNLETYCVQEEKEICTWILTTTHNLSNRKYQYLTSNHVD